MQTMYFMRGARITFAIQHTGERVPGTYTLGDDPDVCPVIEMHVEDGTYEWAAARVESDDRAVLYFEGETIVPIARIE